MSAFNCRCVLRAMDPMIAKLSPRKRQELDEIGLKAAAKIRLIDVANGKDNQIVVFTDPEFVIGFNLLERDDELPKLNRPKKNIETGP